MHQLLWGRVTNAERTDFLQLYRDDKSEVSTARTHDDPDSGHTPAQFSANGHTWNISPMCPRPQEA